MLIKALCGTSFFNDYQDTRDYKGLLVLLYEAIRGDVETKSDEIIKVVMEENDLNRECTTLALRV